MEAIQKEFINFLLFVLITVISIALNQAKRCLKKYEEKIIAETGSTRVKNAIEKINHVAEKVVQSIEQTTAKDMRKALADGKIEKAELEDLALQAYETIQKICSDEMDILAETMDDVDAYIQSLIEAEVLKIKQQMPFILDQADFEA